MNTKEKINSGSKEVQIWDMPLRGFHLLLILSIGFLLATGFLAPEWWLNYHVQAGYFLMWLLIFRLSWGLLGSQYSRFSSLKLSYQQFSHWIKTLNKKTSQNITGHNPAGSWMIVMMFGKSVV